LKSYRYQPTRTPCEIYSDPRGSNQNFTATNGQRKPKESHDNFFGFWKWQEIEALGYAKTMGWRIWVNVEEDIE
jgi:hypothetical protein